MCNRFSKGFTLIEIMIVIAIIGILAGIFLPNLMRARSEANLSSCKQNLKAIATAAEMYLVRHKAERTIGGEASIEMLVDAGCLAEYPKCPAGGLYILILLGPGSAESMRSFGDYLVTCTGGAHAGAGCSGDFPRYARGVFIHNMSEASSFGGATGRPGT